MGDVGGSPVQIWGGAGIGRIGLYADIEREMHLVEQLHIVPGSEVSD
jgi:hypothetical protein